MARAAQPAVTLDIHITMVTAKVRSGLCVQEQQGRCACCVLACSVLLCYPHVTAGNEGMLRGCRKTWHQCFSASRENAMSRFQCARTVRDALQGIARVVKLIQLPHAGRRGTQELPVQAFLNAIAALLRLAYVGIW